MSTRKRSDEREMKIVFLTTIKSDVRILGFKIWYKTTGLKSVTWGLEGRGCRIWKRGQCSHSWLQSCRSPSRLNWAGILRWGGGMSHMLSISCLVCLPQRRLRENTSGHHLLGPNTNKLPCLPLLQDVPCLLGRKSSLLRQTQASPPATAPFPLTPTAEL